MRSKNQHFWACALHQRAFPVRLVAFHPKACYLKVRVEKSWKSRTFHCSLRHLNLKIGPWQVVHSQLPLPAAKVPQHLGVQDGQRKRNPHNSRNSCVFEMPFFHCEINKSHFGIKCSICDASVTSAAWLLASSLGILRKVFTSLQISSIQQHPLSLVYLIMTSDARSLKKKLSKAQQIRLLHIKSIQHSPNHVITSCFCMVCQDLRGAFVSGP